MNQRVPSRPLSFHAKLSLREDGRALRRTQGDMGKKPSQSSLTLPRVIGETPVYGFAYPKSRIRRFAAANKRNPTNAERRFGHILMGLNGGILRRRFRTQHPISGKWVVDFFFPEVRLAVELDGGHHEHGEQAVRDRSKERDCQRFDITLVHFTNAEVFGNREALVEKLRRAWASAKARENAIVGKDLPRK